MTEEHRFELGSCRASFPKGLGEAGALCIAVRSDQGCGRGEPVFRRRS